MVLRMRLVHGVCILLLYASSSVAVLVPITSEQQFQQVVLNNAKPVIVQFAAKWCGACKAAKPLFETLSNDQELKDTIVFAFLDVEGMPSIAQRYGIMGVPTFIFFKNGAIKGRSEGFEGQLFAQKMRERIADYFGIRSASVAAAHKISASVSVANGGIKTGWKESIKEVAQVVFSHACHFFLA